MSYDSYSNYPISEKSRQRRVKRISDRLSQAHQNQEIGIVSEEEQVIRQLGYAATLIEDSKDLNPQLTQPELDICNTEWFPHNLPGQEDLHGIPRDTYKIA